MLVLKKLHYPEKVDDLSLYPFIYLEQHGITCKRKVFRVRRSGFLLALKEKVKVARWCHPTLCNPVDYIVHGILQARVLEWVAFPFSRGSSQPRVQTQVSHIAGGFFTG